MCRCLQDENAFFSDTHAKVLPWREARRPHGFLGKSRTTTRVEADFPDLGYINRLSTHPTIIFCVGGSVKSGKLGRSRSAIDVRFEEDILRRGHGRAKFDLGVIDVLGNLGACCGVRNGDLGRDKKFIRPGVDRA